MLASASVKVGFNMKVMAVYSNLKDEAIIAIWNGSSLAIDLLVDAQQLNHQPGGTPEKMLLNFDYSMRESSRSHLWDH